MKYNITLKPVKEKEISYLKEKMDESFAIAVREHFGDNKPNVSPPADILDNAYHETGSKLYKIMRDELEIGCVVLKIDENTQHNRMDLFFVFKEFINQGLGRDVWKAIEQKYPQTLVWELITPYFERRNIHFYVNKCGFHIVEYFNKYHPYSNMPSYNMQENGQDVNKEVEDYGCFRFVKEMYKKQQN